MHRVALVFVNIFLFTSSSAKALFAQQNLLATNNGFCSEGAYPSTNWPEGRPKSIDVWGSYCAHGDQSVGSAITFPFQATAMFTLYLSGYPDSAGVELSLENLADHSKIAIQPHDDPGTRWLPYRFITPAAWIGKPIRLVAIDNATELNGWLGFSRPVPATPIWSSKEAANLVLRASSHLLLLLVVPFALCAYAVGKGVRDIALLGLIALSATAVPGYVIFWLWLLSPRVGHAISFLVPLIALAALPFLLRRIGRPGRLVLKPLFFPTALVFASALTISSAGFAYGGMRAPFPTAWDRFSHRLPPDNELPYLFAEGLRYGHVPHPLLGDWLSSDRPPLQTAIVLSHYPFLPQPRALGYQVLSVLLQSTWILALWILLVTFEIDVRAIRLIIATTLFWGFTLVNSFFVWPKLLAASYAIGAFAILLPKKCAEPLNKGNLLSLLAGALIAFAMLAHGGSAFAFIGLLLTLLLKRSRFSLRAIVLLTFSCAAIYLPWLLYQKFYDPPGNFLLKLQLAGVEHVDTQSLLTDVIAAYHKLIFHNWLDGREYNVSMVINHQREYWGCWRNLVTSIARGETSGVYNAARELRSDLFFHFGLSLGWLEAGPFVLIAGLRSRYRTQEWRTSALLWTFVACTIVPWCLVMFTPGSTSLHQGTYVAVLLAASGSVLALWAVSHWLAYVVSAAQVLQTLLLYWFFIRTPSDAHILLEGTPDYGVITLFFSALLLCCFLIARFPAGQAHCSLSDSSSLSSR